MKTISPRRHWRLAWLAVLLALGLLTACGATPTSGATPADADQSALQPTSTTVRAATGLTREDGQGAVTVKVTPLNLDRPADTLDFAVVLDTHSVDLSMDLRQLAFLRTDTGLEVQPSAWPVGSGHHYEAILSFPAQTAAGQNLLEGATRLKLVIKDVDAPDRMFEWDLAR